MASINPEEQRQFGLNGRAYAQKEFGRDLLMDRLEDLFNEAVSQFKT